MLSRGTTSLRTGAVRHSQRACIHTSRTHQAIQRPFKIVEVGPRDGLQNEPTILDPHTRATLISRLHGHGLTTIEAGSFVSPKLKQMSNTDQVLLDPLVRQVAQSGAVLQVLLPNSRGVSRLTETLETARETGSILPNTEVSVFASASESFSKANLNTTVAKSLDVYAQVVEAADKMGLRVRGYVSCIVGCPFEGAVDICEVTSVARSLLDMGCYEISLGDTIGVGTPASCERVWDAIMTISYADSGNIAFHCHDTYGMAVPNILHLHELGLQIADSSLAGLGGCPHAPGASGNVATEDLVYALEMQGQPTGLAPNAHSLQDDFEGHRQQVLSDLLPLAETGEWISQQLGRKNSSKVGQAILAQAKRQKALAT